MLFVCLFLIVKIKKSINLIYSFLLIFFKYCFLFMKDEYWYIKNLIIYLVINKKEYFLIML